MELRLLEYFLAVAREQSITKAALYLHITQPTLSRQLSDLENELGKTLLNRGKRIVTLTEDGLFFKKRAEEILSLTKRTVLELQNNDTDIKGDVYIGTGESASISNIIRVCHKIQQENPDVKFHFTSGDSFDLLDRLDKGLFDFCIVYGDINKEKYDFIELPYKERWGLIFNNNLPLKDKEYIVQNDLIKIPLIVSRQPTNSALNRWLEGVNDMLSIKNTYNLINNAILMAKEDMGYLLCLDNVANINGTSLIFRPLMPEVTTNISIIWKKYKPLTRSDQKLIDEIHKFLIKK